MKSKSPHKVLFLISPFLGLPIYLFEIYKNRKFSPFLISIIFGLLSFMYIPMENNDKAYYLLLYKDYGYYNFNQFLYHLLDDKTDFIFYTAIYLFAWLKISYAYIFYILTSITVYNIFYIFNIHATKLNLNKKYFFLFFLILLFSFSLPHLLSGIRFYLGGSFILLGLHLLFYEKRPKIGYLYLIVGSLTHFSTIVFLIGALIIHVLKPKEKIITYFFILSFLFLLIPRGELNEVFSALGLSGIYAEKLNAYLGEADFLENSISIGNFNNYIKILFDGLWLYVALFYLLITYKSKSSIKYLLYAMLGITNIFMSAPTIYARYLLIIKVLFILLLIHDCGRFYRKDFLYRFFLIILSLNFIMDIIMMREIFINSYFDSSTLTLPTILLNN